MKPETTTERWRIWPPFSVCRLYIFYLFFFFYVRVIFGFSANAGGKCGNSRVLVASIRTLKRCPRVVWLTSACRMRQRTCWIRKIPYRDLELIVSENERRGACHTGIHYEGKTVVSLFFGCNYIDNCCHCLLFIYLLLFFFFFFFWLCQWQHYLILLWGIAFALNCCLLGLVLIWQNKQYKTWSCWTGWYNI